MQRSEALRGPGLRSTQATVWSFPSRRQGPTPSTPLVPHAAHLLLEAGAVGVEATEHGQLSSQVTAAKETPLLVLGTDVLLVGNR